ncbi:DUF4192 family protein [Microbacterium sp. RURRCA19A]|uniref:DUF4192 family protein n=1 Tax=Microbacterium sp. RURRCA19A TaxID=1907391 RepID=UPI000956B87D|nr:DUF4192 family protein [Microbacterium sp. RURRCA19A]SIR89338.1 protein of unknown function [Microbacterium sp. RURRCA19A]
MSPIVRAGAPAEFLALVPHLLGCTPRSSLALVTFAAGRSLGALRIDLPAPDSDAEVENVASTVIGMACKVSRTDAVAAVVYTDLPLRDAGSAPHRALVDAVVARADICGLRVIDAFAVGPDGWIGYLAGADGEPRPLEEIAADPDLTRTPELDGDQYAAATLPPVPTAERTAVNRLLTDAGHLVARSREAKRLPAGRRAAARLVLDDIADPPALFEAFVSPDEDPDDRAVAAVSFCLQRPLLRDVALMQWIGDLTTGDATYRAQTAHAAGHPFPADLARPMWGEGARPDPPRLLRALDRCRHLAAATPRSRRAGPLAACAWLAWATGGSTHAAAYAADALDIDPDHGLADIVRIMCAQGRLPEWVFEREAVTSPGGTESSRGSRAR